MEENPFTLLTNMSHGGHSSCSTPVPFEEDPSTYCNEIELQSNEDDSSGNDISSDENDSEFDSDTGKGPSTSKKKKKKQKTKERGKAKKRVAPKRSLTGKTKKAKGKTVASLKLSELLSFEEQQEIEEPVEIDMRNVAKAYGINPMESARPKTCRKLSNADIINSSIGEASFKFSRGKDEEGLSLLLEMIRTNPNNAQPYEELGEYYMREGDYKKALDFFMLGIQFNPNDTNRWVQLAEIANLNRMYKSSAEFYSRAIKLSPKNTTYYIKKGNLLEQIRQYENALKTYEKLLSTLEQENDIKTILSIEFRIAAILTRPEVNKPDVALEVVEKTLKHYTIDRESDSEQFDSFVQLYLNSYFDLLFKNGKYTKALATFLEYGLVHIDGIKPSTEYNMEELIDSIYDNPESVHFPARYANELVLKSKFTTIFIYLDRLSFAERFLGEFASLEHDPHLAESIYPTLVEAFIHADQFEKAYSFVEALVQLNDTSSRYWYWCGLCLSKLRPVEQLEVAIEAFENAIRYDRNNYDAVNELSLICNQIGDPERALDHVNLMESTHSYDFKLLFNRCNLLYICKRWDDFITAAHVLLSSDMFFFQDYSDINAHLHPNISTASWIRMSKRLLRAYLKRNKLTKLTGGRLSTEQSFDLWKRVVFVLLNFTKQYTLAIQWAFSGLLSIHFEKLHLPMTLVMFRSCLDAKWVPFTYELVRYLLKEHPKSGKLWYAFSVTMNDIYQDFRHKRFCMRVWKHHPEEINTLMMNGHIALLNGRYRHALAIFLLVYRRESPFRYDSFYIGLCYLHLLMQNHTLDKCSLLAQMLAFFDDYIQKVGKCQETYYNLGRVYHQIGFFRHAVELYTVALYTPLKVHDKRFDLTPEIAFNLSQIYRRSGDHRRANQLIMKHCTI